MIYNYNRLFCYHEDGSLDEAASMRAFREHAENEMEAFKAELGKKNLEISSHLPAIKEAVNKAFDICERRYPNHRGHYFLMLAMRAVENMPGFTEWEGDFAYCGKFHNLIDTYISTCSEIVVESTICVFRKKTNGNS